MIHLCVSAGCRAWGCQRMSITLSTKGYRTCLSFRTFHLTTFRRWTLEHNTVIKSGGHLLSSATLWVLLAHSQSSSVHQVMLQQSVCHHRTVVIVQVSMKSRDIHSSTQSPSQKKIMTTVNIFLLHICIFIQGWGRFCVEFSATAQV